MIPIYSNTIFTVRYGTVQYGNSQIKNNTQVVMILFITVVKSFCVHPINPSFRPKNLYQISLCLTVHTPYWLNFNIGMREIADAL